MQERIISHLREKEGFISGEEISRQLRVSRAGIWKHIRELRRQGYRIEALPHEGYRLVSVPDKLFPGEIAYRLNTVLIGKEIIYKKEVTSTMDEAFVLGTAGCPDGTVICAENQTKGRGRMGRSWVSPKGKGVYFSAVLRPRLDLSDAPKMTLLFAAAVCEALREVSNLPVKIKWPNDLMVENKKIAGILTELNAEIDRIRFMVVGLGININSALTQLPSQSASLKSETKKSFSRVLVMQKVLRALDEWYIRMQKEGFVPVMDRWKELSMTLGQRVRLSDADGVLDGVAVDLSPEGGLIIEQDDGARVKRMSGDVSLRLQVS